MRELRQGLPHLYERPWYAWAWSFFQSRNKMSLLCAANQISKSSTMIRKAIEWAGNPALWPELWPSHTPRIFWYFYPDQDTINQEVKEKWEPEFLPRFAYKEHETYGWSFVYGDRKKDIDGIKFNSGVTIMFKSHTQKISNLQSGTISAVFADEELPVLFYPEINARLFASHGYYNMVFTATLNQDMWKRAIEGKGDAELFPQAFKLQVSMFDCLLYKDGSPSTWTEERIYEILDSCSTEAERQRRVYGKFVAAQGLKYGNFDSSRHYVKPFEIPANWHRYAGVDHGSGGENHKPAISFIAVRPDFRYAVVYKHWRGDDGSTYTAGDTLNKFLELKPGNAFTSQRVDPRATDFLTLAARTGEPFVPADSSHTLGEDVINTLFKNNMLFLFDEREEMPKLGGELSTLLKETPKNRAKDDSCDSLRYGVVTIPWDWTYLKGELSDREKKKDAERKEREKTPEEIEIDEILAEILGEEKEGVEEGTDIPADEYVTGTQMGGVATGLALGVAGLAWSSLDKKQREELITNAKAALQRYGDDLAGAFKWVKDKAKGIAGLDETADVKEMGDTINELRNELNEVNLLNAKLLYTNKIFKAKNLTESEKVKVLNTFDKAETVKEVKLVFETLTESFKTTNKKAAIKESLGSASRSIAPATPKQPIIEVNDAFARMQRLAGLRK